MRCLRSRRVCKGVGRYLTYPSIAKANVESQKLGPVEKKTCATMPSDLPFHSATH
jgi:hypothetical protein